VVVKVLHIVCVSEGTKERPAKKTHAVEVNTDASGTLVHAAVLAPETVVGPGERVAVGVGDRDDDNLEAVEDGRGVVVVAVALDELGCLHRM